MRVVADVSTAEGAAAVVSAAEERFGGVDIVVNNVGGSGAKHASRTWTPPISRPCSTRTSFPPCTSPVPRCPRSGPADGGVIAIVSSICGRGGGRRPELQHRQGGGDQPGQVDGARSREGRDARVQRRARARRCFPGGAGTGACGRIPKGSTAFIEREIPWGRLRHGRTRSPTSSRSSSRRARRGWSGRASRRRRPVARVLRRMPLPQRKTRNPISRLPSVAWDPRPHREPSRSACARQEEAWLSPLAVRSFETPRRALPEEPCSRAHAVPARPRPDRALEAVPAAEGEDAGLHRPGRATTTARG